MPPELEELRKQLCEEMSRETAALRAQLAESERKGKMLEQALAKATAEPERASPQNRICSKELLVDGVPLEFALGDRANGAPELHFRGALVATQPALPIDALCLLAGLAAMPAPHPVFYLPVTALNWLQPTLSKGRGARAAPEDTRRRERGAPAGARPGAGR